MTPIAVVERKQVGKSSVFCSKKVDANVSYAEAALVKPDNEIIFSESQVSFISFGAVVCYRYHREKLPTQKIRFLNPNHPFPDRYFILKTQNPFRISFSLAIARLQHFCKARWQHWLSSGISVHFWTGQNFMQVTWFQILGYNFVSFWFLFSQPSILDRGQESFAWIETVFSVRS